MSDNQITKKRDEEITNRILIIFCLSLLTLLGVMFIYRIMVSSPAQLAMVVRITFISGLILCVPGIAAMIMAWLRRAQDDFRSGRLALLSAVCFIYAGILLLIHYKNFEAFSVLYIALPVVAFLYLIYNIYQKDFFWQCIVIGCSGGVLYAFSRWLHYKPWQPIVHIAYISAIVLLIAGCLFTLILQKRQGELFGITIFPIGVNYNLIFTTFGLMLLTIIAVLILGSTVAFWAMIGVFAYLFVLAVYYTIRLM